MEIDPGLLAPCGLYCGVCGVYYATRDQNEKFLQKLLNVYQSSIPKLDELTTEDLECDGCLSDRVSFFCRVCAIKSCTSEKGYTGCYECDDFPCSHVENFPMTEKWVKDEESRYLCPECGHRLFRGAKRCNECKTPVDLD
jgi:hypothetical protein